MASILKLVRPETAFDPEAVSALASAFEMAWDRLRQSGSECARPSYAGAMREVVARLIIEMAQRGIRDQQELTDGVVRFLTNYRHEAKNPRP